MTQERTFTVEFNAEELAAVGLGLEDEIAFYGSDPNVGVAESALQKVLAVVKAVPDAERQEIAEDVQRRLNPIPDES